MITEAIILAGGLGTRLRDKVPELPKCMAPVNNKPFIEYVIHHFQKQGIQKFIFALGYKSELFQNFLNSIQGIQYQISIEDEPLGTGGAIQLACSLVNEENVIITNGDTLYKANLNKLSSMHLQHNADCTLCLKPMNNFDRYGVVELNESGIITSFKEKNFYTSGLINGGIYALNKKRFIKEGLPAKFSFEKDYLERAYMNQNFYGCVQDEYFIDIGIPEDYKRAAKEITNEL